MRIYLHLQKFNLRLLLADLHFVDLLDQDLQLIYHMIVFCTDLSDFILTDYLHPWIIVSLS